MTSSRKLATPKIYEADFDNEKTFVIVMEPTVGARSSPQFNLGSLMHGEFVHILFILCDYIGFRMAESDAM